MYDRTITLFNYRKADGCWYTHTFTGVDAIETQGKSATTHGMQSADNLEVIIHCTSTQQAGGLQYVPPKVWQSMEDVEGCFTLTPECDFIAIGDCSEVDPINDEEYDQGLYHALNEERDDVFMITSATWFSLLPHFEIGGR